MRHKMLRLLCCLHHTDITYDEPHDSDLLTSVLHAGIAEAASAAVVVGQGHASRNRRLLAEGAIGDYDKHVL